MMQNGTVMMQGNSVTFDKMPANLQRELPPGEAALRFYIDFASPSKEVYCWNSELPSSVEQFAQGNAAFFFGYSYHVPYIKNLAPKLNFAVTKAPQIENSQEINYANYWAYTVSSKTKYSNEAWNFIQFITTNADNNAKYLEKTQKPAALRSLISSQLEDPTIGAFAAQSLTAQSWYQGALLNSGRTRGISEAVATFLFVTGLGLLGGVVWGKMIGLYVGLAALSFGMLIQTFWLWVRSRPVLRTLCERDHCLETQV